MGAGAQVLEVPSDALFVQQATTASLEEADGEDATVFRRCWLRRQGKKHRLPWPACYAVLIPISPLITAMQVGSGLFWMVVILPGFLITPC